MSCSLRLRLDTVLHLVEHGYPCMAAPWCVSLRR
jgi:hypothetical protein